jgi:hypothetical protein
MEKLNKISDSLACKIADLACGFSSENEHEVIDRIFGIDVGLMGKYNETFTVDFIEENGIVKITYFDRNQFEEIQEIKNKEEIIKLLNEIGISDVVLAK